MRIRTIKPEFFKSEEIADLPPLERLLFIGLWCAADANGVLENRPRRIKAEVLPYDEINIAEALNSLCAGGFLTCYGEATGPNPRSGGEAPGKHLGNTWSETAQYLMVSKFRKHQRISGKEAQNGGRYPLPDSDLDDSGKDKGDAPPKGKHSGSTREAPLKHPGAQEQGTGNREQGTGNRELKIPHLMDPCRDITLNGGAVTANNRTDWNSLVLTHGLDRLVQAVKAEAPKAQERGKDVWPNNAAAWLIANPKQAPVVMIRHTRPDFNPDLITPKVPPLDHDPTLESYDDPKDFELPALEDETVGP